MSDKKNPAPTERASDEQDVEGHNMWIGPTVSGDLARQPLEGARAAARDRQRSKDAKTR